MSLIGLAFTAVFAAMVLGASTNAVNGLVSPIYFINILGWHHVDNVWRASIAQGILEGSVLGVFLSVVFTATVATITRGTCPYRRGFKLLLQILAGTYCCWAVGGLIVMGLATLSPEFYRNAFIGVPADFTSMLAYAWVGGSIWGIEMGGIASTIIGLAMFRGAWRRDQPETRTAHAPAAVAD